MMPVNIVFAASAEDTEIAVGTVAESLHPGDEVTIPVNFVKNPGITGLDIEITFVESVFELVSITPNTEFGGEFTEKGNGKGYIWDNGSNVTKLDTIFSVTLKVLENAQAGETIVGLNVPNCSNYALEEWVPTLTSATITIEYAAEGLTFDNGTQIGLTYDQVRAEALGEGTVTLTTPGEGYLFAGWFSDLDVNTDDNGFYVIDPSTDAEFAGTEFRPRYDTPPTEGTYNALWIKDNGSTVLTVGETNTVQVGTDDAAALTAAVTAANGTARVKLVENLAMTAEFIIESKVHLDVNGCTLSSTAANSFQTAGEDNTIESSRSGALIKGSGTVIATYVDYNDSNWPEYGSFALLRDVCMESNSQNQNVFATKYATTVQNCVFGGYVQFNSATGTSTVDNCTFESTGVVVVSNGETTITNTELSATGSVVPFQGGYSGGTIKLGAGNDITVTNAANLCSNATAVHINSIESTYQIAETATVPFKNVTTVSVVEGMQYGIANGLLKFGNTAYTVTYKNYGGTEAIEEVTVLAGCPADLTKTANYADTKYKHGGWALEANSSTALTSHTVDKDTTLYAVRLEAGPLDPYGKEITTDEYTKSLGAVTTAAFKNANKLGNLNSMALEYRYNSTKYYTTLTFSAAALDSIADLVSSEAAFNAVRTEPGEADEFVAKVDLSVMEGTNAINFAGAVEVKIDFAAETGKSYRVYFIDENGEAHGLATTVTTTTSKATAKFTTTHFSTFEVRETTVAEGYTAGLSITETEVRAGGNTVNVTVDVSHSSDTTFNAAEIKVSYDPALLTPVTTDLATDTFKVDNGVLTIEDYGVDKTIPYTYKLSFTTCASVTEDTTATITLSGAAFADSVDARSENLNVATIDPASDSVNIQLEAFKVTLPANDELAGDTTIEGATEAVKNADYTFNVSKDEHYTYAVTATVGEGDTATTVTVTESTTESGKYTIAGDYVTGPITITVTATAKQYDVTFKGEEPAANDGNQATHDTPYKFTLPTKAQWQYSYAITIDGTEYTGASAENNVVTIPGDAITGAIEVTISCEQTEFNLTLNGEDATVKNEDGTEKYDKGDTAIVTITPAEGYTYTVTAVKTGTEETVAVKDNGDNTYTIADITSDITITVTKTLTGTVNVDLYLTLDATNTENPSLSMFLVTFDGTLNDGYIPYCNDDAMYWSSQYNAYAYLVTSTDLETAKTNVAVSVKSGDKTAQTITYTYNVNASTNIDAADAQLVYDMYKAEYKDFDTVNMMKFLLADVNNTKTVDTTDAAKIIREILNPTTTG